MLIFGKETGTEESVGNVNIGKKAAMPKGHLAFQIDIKTVIILCQEDYIRVTLESHN